MGCAVPGIFLTKTCTRITLSTAVVHRQCLKEEADVLQTSASRVRIISGIMQGQAFAAPSAGRRAPASSRPAAVAAALKFMQVFMHFKFIFLRRIDIPGTV